MFAAETERYCALDGELSDLDSDIGPDLIPWISSNWASTFHWDGHGEMPAHEQSKLQEMAAKARAKGCRLRFWNSPDNPDFWAELLMDGVDLINTDKLVDLQQFFNLDRRDRSRL